MNATMFAADTGSENDVERSIWELTPKHGTQSRGLYTQYYHYVLHIKIIVNLRVESD
jgi:hypothetical protein